MPELKTIVSYKDYWRPDWLTPALAIREGVVEKIARLAPATIEAMSADLDVMIRRNADEYAARHAAWKTLCANAERAYGTDDPIVRKLKRTPPVQPPALRDFWRKLTAKVGDQRRKTAQNARHNARARVLRLAANYGGVQTDYWWQCDPERA